MGTVVTICPFRKDFIECERNCALYDKKINQCVLFQLRYIEELVNLIKKDELPDTEDELNELFTECYS